MRIVVPIHLRYEDCLVDEDRPLARVEDPAGREVFAVEDSWRFRDLLDKAFRRKGLRLIIVAADPGAQTGRLLLNRVEIPHGTANVDRLVPTIEEIVVETFGRL